MFDRITSGAPSAVHLAHRKSLKRQWKVKKEHWEVEGGVRKSERAIILQECLKSSTILDVEITIKQVVCVFFCSFIFLLFSLSECANRLKECCLKSFQHGATRLPCV